MEMEQQEKLLTLLDETQASAPSSVLLKVITRWVGIFMELHHKEVSELGMVAYIEGLKDLSPKEVEQGCRRALKEIDRMPTPAHIRERVRQYGETAIYVEKPAAKYCDNCKPDGWIVVQRLDMPGYSWAKRCPCQKS